ncbi:20S core proteasome subunit beta 4 [Cyanidioschyzon merolae strain 10D]|uniref:Proteasome subunit beta n=1 Tax=Cyanidioschyzon merolae (strain NIES-3377 / 10D) TaxID=280699 RepID=M1V4Z8_CYAM1|nr:20S core proteasome subunit beta 4 [Cyanidioschyzon merolae strain 10D]BAM79795.1 20S core proteasome subunit beta 4 [Cyanidioschyzon merolae strain 10D]|eukprot:XP_005536081.1 20S core proteasome subunit beta 4 [Cyanidioschyzon merolae strain 10D]
MDTAISLAGKDFVLSAADVTAARSIVVMKEDQDKIQELDRFRLLSAGGDLGDVAQFTEYIQRNVHLYELRAGTSLSTRQIAHFIRGELARALRERPYEINLILGGYDQGEGTSLYYIDYLGSLHMMKYTAQGYAAYFVLSTLDRLYRPNMNLEEALEVLRACLDEMGRRFLLKQRHFMVKIADERGVRVLENAFVDASGTPTSSVTGAAAAAATS